jgi:16S rRNA processing protein RimM
MPADRVLVARVGAAQGIRGEVRLWSYTADPMALKDYAPLETVDGRRIAIEALRAGKGFLVARVADVNDRTAAEALTNLELYVSRDRLPPPDEDEFYHADLIGLEAVTADGARLGIVIGLHDFGAGELIELRPQAGQSILVPFTRENVPVIDIVGGRLVINPPAGLLDGAETPAAHSREGGNPVQRGEASSPPSRRRAE